jgi:hypothetical protein
MTWNGRGPAVRKVGSPAGRLPTGKESLLTFFFFQTRRQDGAPFASDVEAIFLARCQEVLPRQLTRRFSMLRKLAVVLSVFALVLGVALADEIKATVKSVDADKGTIKVTVKDGDKETDKEFKVSKEVKLSKLGKGVKALADIKADTKVILTTDKDTVTEIKGDKSK